MIRFEQKGDFEKTRKFLKEAGKRDLDNILNKYGKMGVENLSAYTPRDTGLTASSWTYTIEKTKNKVSITWRNTNVVDGVPIAIILQYGNATRNGGYVEGVDYINPALEPVFKELKDRIWREVSKS